MARLSQWVWWSRRAAVNSWRAGEVVGVAFGLAEAIQGASRPVWVAALGELPHGAPQLGHGLGQVVEVG
jgi:hypothetical protein